MSREIDLRQVPQELVEQMVETLEQKAAADRCERFAASGFGKNTPPLFPSKAGAVQR